MLSGNLHRECQGDHGGARTFPEISDGVEGGHLRQDGQSRGVTRIV